MPPNNEGAEASSLLGQLGFQVDTHPWWCRLAACGVVLPIESVVQQQQQYLQQQWYMQQHFQQEGMHIS